MKLKAAASIYLFKATTSEVMATAESLHDAAESSDIDMVNDYIQELEGHLAKVKEMIEGGDEGDEA